MSRTHGHPDDRATWPVRAALACYPAPWRARYGEELQATLAQLPRSGASTARAVVDLGIGAIDAWLHPIPDPRSKPVTDETTRLIPPTAWGLLLFLFGGAAFAKVNDDPAFTAATHHHPALAACFYALAISAFAAAGVMGLATLPSLVLLLRQGQARHDAAPLIAVPLALAWFAGAILVARSLGGQWGPHAAVNVALFIGLCCVSVGVGVVVTIALIRVAVRVPEKPVVVATRRVAMIALAGGASLRGF